MTKIYQSTGPQDFNAIVCLNDGLHFRFLLTGLAVIALKQPFQYHLSIEEDTIETCVTLFYYRNQMSRCNRSSMAARHHTRQVRNIHRITI